MNFRCGDWMDAHRSMQRTEAVYFAWGRSSATFCGTYSRTTDYLFRKNHQEEYSTTLEFPDKARVTLPTRIITMENYSPLRLEECGLILFLPFLLEGYIENMERRQLGWTALFSDG